MKKLILILITFLPLLAIAQSGGSDRLRLIHRELIGNGDSILIRIDDYGKEHPIKLDNQTIYIENDTLKGASQFELDTASTTILGGVKIDGATIIIDGDGVISATAQGLNYDTINLTGTTPTWDLSVATNANITLTGNTTITITNAPVGRSGNLVITNGTSTYTLNVTGFTNAISRVVGFSGNYTRLGVSGANGKVDVFSWYYNGNYLIWNGNLEYIKQ